MTSKISNSPLLYDLIPVRQLSDFPDFSKKLTPWLVVFRELKFKRIEWEPINSNDEIIKYMDISSSSRGMIDEPFSTQVKFFTEIDIIP